MLYKLRSEAQDSIGFKEMQDERLRLLQQVETSLIYLSMESRCWI
jgi:hypothetical protein